jgi:L-ribulokinase
MTLVAGVDFGTATVRVSIFDSERGRLGASSAEYPVYRHPKDGAFATQRHEDHCTALERAVHGALAAAEVEGKAVHALAVDTTGSTVVPVDEHLQPLDDYYLWCDHRAWREAKEITTRAREQHLGALDWCGGTYSSEWGFAKVLHWLRSHPRERRRLQTAAEHCDLMTAHLCGITDPSRMPRSVCAMGHKWMWNESLGGLPPEGFLSSVDPLLSGLRDRLAGRYLTSDQIAGGLSEEWGHRLGFKPDIPIPVGALDAHWDAIGAGCRLSDVVNVVGTSSCLMALADEPRVIPGVSGIVQGSIHPKRLGIEAGLSAVGDLFESIARRAGTTVSALSEKIRNYRPGQTGLTRLAWDNGDRSVLVNPELRGVALGWRLNHTAEDELFAAIEGTAFHTRIIFERLREYGVPINQVIHAGGIPQRNETLNRVYAGVLGMPVLLPVADTRSLGSAIFAFLAAGTFKSVEDAQEALDVRYRVIEPAAGDVGIYEDLFCRFRELYFRLGQQAP